MIVRHVVALSVAAWLAGSASPALAYVGPGAGITLIGSVIGLLAVIAAALGVIVMMPIRAARRRFAANAAATATEPEKRES